MDNLPDILVVCPSLPSSRPFFVAEEPSCNLLLLHQFLHETHDRLRFSPDQIPIPNHTQVNGLSNGESILIPFLCSSLNALGSMTKQLDTITTQLATIQSIVVTLPTSSALDSKLSPIHASLRDLSHGISTAPRTLAATVGPPGQNIPPGSMVTGSAALHPAPKPPAPPASCEDQQQYALRPGHPPL